MVDLAKRVVARWVAANVKRERKKRDAWATKLNDKIQLAARQVEGVDPDDWDHSYSTGYAIWAPGDRSYDSSALPLGYEFEATMSSGYVRAEVLISVWFEDGGSKRYRVKTEVLGKKLSTVEKTGRRLKVTDFFKPLQSYVNSHKDELITPETPVWYSTDPSGNMYFGLTKGAVEWREGYADYFSSLENLQLELPWDLRDWEGKAKELKEAQEAEENAIYEAADAAEEDADEAVLAALVRKYRSKLEALEPAFQAAVKKWLDSEWYVGKDKLKDIVKSPRDVAAIISDLKARGSAGL